MGIRFSYKLGLFKRHPKLLNGEKYTIKSDINRNVLDLFMTRLLGAETTEKVTEENVEQLRDICNELGYSGFDDEIRSVLGNGTIIVRRDMMGLRSRVDRHDIIVEELRARITELELQVQKQGQALNAAKNLEETTQALIDDLRRDVSGRINELAEEVQHLKRELKVSCADVKSLANDVSALKDAERRTGGEVRGILKNPANRVLSTSNGKFVLKPVMKTPAGLLKCRICPIEPTFRVDEEDIEVNRSEPLAHGCCDIFKGTYKRSSPPMTVAVKVYFSSEHFTSTVDIMKKMTHPGTLHLVGYRQTSSEKVILTPFMPNGTAADVLKRERDGRPHPQWDATKKSLCVFGVAAAMMYIHSRRIVHCCLTSDNILLDEKMEPVIGGFSFATLIGSDMGLQPRDPSRFWPLTRHYPAHMAPELWNGHDHDGSIDVYAYAVFLFQFFGSLFDILDDRSGPFKNHADWARRITGGARFARPKNAIPDFYWNLIVRCWEQDPKKRLTFCQIVDYLQKHRSEYAFPGANLDALREYEQRVLKGVELIDRTC